MDGIKIVYSDGSEIWNICSGSPEDVFVTFDIYYDIDIMVQKEAIEILKEYISNEMDTYIEVIDGEKYFVWTSLHDSERKIKLSTMLNMIDTIDWASTYIINRVEHLIVDIPL